MRFTEKEVKETEAFLRRKATINPEVGIILGTGLGGLGEKIEVDRTFPYREIPNFPVSTVESHRGRLIFGALQGKKVVAMQGRFHYYEGYSMEEITFPIRVFGHIGAKVLIVSNAAGGLDSRFRRGDLMVISDHINLMGTNPLIGPNVEAWGPRFPDMCEPYSKKLIRLAVDAAKEEGISIRKGVYAAVFGPSMETAAETRFLRTIGADAVGMSTVPEVIVAKHMGLEILGISVISNVNLPVLKPVPIEEVIQVAKTAEPNLVRIVERVLANLKT